MSFGFKTSGAERPHVFEKCYLEPGDSDNASVPPVERVVRKLCDVSLSRFNFNFNLSLTAGNQSWGQGPHRVPYKFQTCISNIREWTP